MICANVDMGSNTVRLSIYKYEKKRLRLLFHKKKMIGLAAYVENGSLTSEGVQKACEALIEFKEICDNFSIAKIYVFATASLRNINNSSEAVDAIYKETNMRVEVISGSEEARLDFVGVSHGFPLTSGMLVDIGGGSTELVSYQDRKIMQACSMPIGSLRLYKDYVAELFPKKDERSGMKKCVRNNLNKLSGIGDDMSMKICGVGGSIRATLKLQNAIFHLPQTTDTINIIHVKDLINILKTGDTETLHRLLTIIPDRIHTILPGMIILFEIARKFKSKRIFVSRYGVREGYMYDRLEGETENGER